jgi:protein dithiol:quinone oxidoreductase
VPSRRLINVGGFLACVAMLAYAYFYAEKVLRLEPCPLCMFQRVGVGLLGIVFLLAAMQHPASRAGARVYAVLIALVAAFPGYVAGRHVYVQSLPAGSVPSCGATLDYMLDVFPLLTVVRKVLTGGGECANIDWSFLGLSMPGWVLVAVVLLAVMGILANWRVGASRTEQALVASS